LEKNDNTNLINDNEKVSEKLNVNKKTEQTVEKKIFIVNELIPAKEDFFSFIDKLNLATINNQELNLKKLLINFKW
jgi:hypothetical protein